MGKWSGETASAAKTDALRSERNAFYSARHRCQSPTDRAWKWYGARGIEFRFTSFDEFLKYLGPKPLETDERLTLDRIDTNGHYEVGNVRWATYKVQAANRRPRSCFKLS